MNKNNFANVFSNIIKLRITKEFIINYAKMFSIKIIKDKYINVYKEIL